MKRFNLTLRRPMHKSQQNSQTAKESCRVILKFLNERNRLSKDYPQKLINMDEIPFFFYKSHSYTVEERGVKPVNVVTSGHEKSRFTVVNTFAAS